MTRRDGGGSVQCARLLETEYDDPRGGADLAGLLASKTSLHSVRGPGRSLDLPVLPFLTAARRLAKSLNQVKEMKRPRGYI